MRERGETMAEGKTPLWSVSTTIREADRVPDFLRVAQLFEGKDWTREAQIGYQIHLISRHCYLDASNAQARKKLTDEQIELLRDTTKDIPLDKAREIFEAKEYEDPAMRGRQSLSPLRKLGLVRYGKAEPIRFLPNGKALLAGALSLGDLMLEAWLKYQYPNPADSGFQDWHTKPFIATLRLIRAVNARCNACGMKAKGISFQEFGIFALSLKDIRDVETVADRVIAFRRQWEKCPNDSVRKQFAQAFIDDYLADFSNPRKNTREYADNVIRYLRLTRYFYIRGKYDNSYLDLEPRRATEIEALLEADPGEPGLYARDAWFDYVGNTGTYPFPFETVPKLTQIAQNIRAEIQTLADTLGLPQTLPPVPTTVPSLKAHVAALRTVRQTLQTRKIRFDSRHDTATIDTAIHAFEDLLRHKRVSGKRPSIDLEHWATVALNILDDAQLIKPNAPLGDDNAPTYTAPGGVADIECLYEAFVATCEVTLLASRDQWYSEGQPVMRHLYDFENKHPNKPGYCLFLAPSLHRDTLNTFKMAIKMEYEGRQLRIVPLTIRQFIDLLTYAKTRIQAGRPLRHTELQAFFDACVFQADLTTIETWQTSIRNALAHFLES